MALTYNLLCYVRGEHDRWQAICVDLDIAVHADTMRGAISLIEDAVGSYIEDAYREEPAVRDELLSRRSPWLLRAELWLQWQAYMLTRRRQHAESYSAFSLPCPA